VRRRYLNVVPRPMPAAPCRYFIVVNTPLPAAPLVKHRRYLIVVPSPMPAAPRRYLNVVPRPMPAVAHGGARCASQGRVHLSWCPGRCPRRRSLCDEGT
jgi:hypothetical protein